MRTPWVVQDADCSQAAVEQMRNSVKVQMANNVIGKSMRMNDLLIDLTTKHHRGAMLNAKAWSLSCSIAKDNV